MQQPRGYAILYRDGNRYGAAGLDQSAIQEVKEDLVPDQNGDQYVNRREKRRKTLIVERIERKTIK
jgi:hypothetical protein